MPDHISLHENEIITALVPDASRVPDVKVLIGLLGKGVRDASWRLYLTPSLNEYVEFDEDDVVHTQALGRDDDGLRGTMVWVKREANTRHTRAESREAQADFLHGRIASEFLRKCRPEVVQRGRRVALLQSVVSCHALDFICAWLAAESVGNYCDPFVTWTAECQ